MNTLIVYSTRRGAVREMARRIAASIPGATCRDIREGSLSLEDYDTVILGSSITVGQIGKELKAFIRDHESTLGEKRLGLFLSGMDENGIDSYFQSNFPAALLESARAKAFLGGVYDPAQCGFLTRTLMKKVSGLTAYTSTVNSKELEAFASAFA